jgi:WD40 repeat protein
MMLLTLVVSSREPCKWRLGLGLMDVWVRVTVQVKVQDLSFSPDDQFLASIGGQDDNSLVLWDVETGAAICGSPTSSEGVSCVSFLNQDAFTLVTAGTHNMDVWAFDPNNRKVKPSACNLGKLRRSVETLVVDSAVRTLP